MLEALKHNLSQLLTFSGRTRPLHFWLYAMAIVVADMVLAMFGGALVMQDVFARTQRFMREHPDQVTVTQTAGGTSWHIEGYHPELLPDFGQFIIAMAIITLVTALLLAAAVTRRLHDSNRRGFWGLLPLPFLAMGFFLFSILLWSLAGRNEPDLPLISLLFANNLIYLLCLAVLALLLCLSGTRGENRFGPPPV